LLRTIAVSKLLVFGLSRETMSKMCQFSLPPGYIRTAPVAKLELGGLLAVNVGILETDRSRQ